MKSPIKQLLVSAVLFLPLCFFLWFYASELLVIPVRVLTEWVLTTWQPDLVKGITQQHYYLNVETLIFPIETFTGNESKLAVLDVAVNPMIYGYGLALLSGLVLSVPMNSALVKTGQILVGYALVVLVQTFGVIWQVFKQLLFSGGPDAQQAVLATGIEPNLVAAMYQLSYLILPAIVPVVTWMLMNRGFIETLTEKKQGNG